MYLSNKCGNSPPDMTIKFFIPKYLEIYFFIICKLIWKNFSMIQSQHSTNSLPWMFYVKGFIQTKPHYMLQSLHIQEAHRFLLVAVTPEARQV